MKIFVLDHRKHPTKGLYSDGLAESQGPALLAFSNAILRTEDWDALLFMGNQKLWMNRKPSPVLPHVQALFVKAGIESH
jgi:hypothetical protein